MQHKRCWRDTVMNRWAIFSGDPFSPAGPVPPRGRPDNFRWGPRGGRDELGRAPGLHWASASSLKWFLQRGRWWTVWAGAVLPRLSQPLRRIQAAGLWIIPNHLASVAAGPTGEFKSCSSRWKDRQCTICPGPLHVTEQAPATNEAAVGDHRSWTVVNAAVL